MIVTPRLAAVWFPLLLLLLSALVQLSKCTLGPQPPASSGPGSRSASGSGSDYQTAQSGSTSTSTDPTTPQTARTSVHRPSSAMLLRTDYHVVYDDEDPAAAKLAWLREKIQQDHREGPGWAYIDHRLKHPSAEFRSAVRTAPAQLEDAGPGFTFGAQKVPETVGERLGEDVPVEKYSGNLADTMGLGFRESVDASPLDSSRPAARGRSRTRYRGSRLRSGGRGAMMASGGSTSRSPPVAVQSEEAPVDAANDNEATARFKSPTRSNLESAAEQLRALQLQRDDSQRGRRASSLPPFSHGSITTPSSSGYDSLAGQHGLWRVATPPSHADGASTWTASTPPSEDAVLVPTKRMPPYRVWSPQAALRRINIRYTRLWDEPKDYQHWMETVDALGRHDWGKQIRDRVLWAGSNRVPDTRSARVGLPFGGMTGSTVQTGVPRFIEDPNDPAPPLASIRRTGTHERVLAWHTLVDMVPPALTAHSSSVWHAHRQGAYHNIHPDVQDSVHPIQYTSQLMRDNDGAVVLENAIHEKLFRALRFTPPEVKAKLQKELGLPRDKYQPLQDVLRADYATYGPFWQDYYKSKLPMKLTNPLDSDLTHWRAFRMWADAVAVKRPLV